MTSQGSPHSRFQLALATGNVALVQAAAALDVLPSRRPAACAALAAVCERAGLKDAARVFTS